MCLGVDVSVSTHMAAVHSGGPICKYVGLVVVVLMLSVVGVCHLCVE